MTEDERLRQWLEQADQETAAELRTAAADAGEIKERFYRDLEFGTGGLRGILGAGTNRMNAYVVRRATRGLAAYMKKSGLPLSAAVSYDSRRRSEEFARTAAETLAACGIEAWIYPRLEPTPALSWAVRALGCGAGIMITASHNPAEYNGYKVYGPDGCQITNRAAEEIFKEIGTVGYFDPLPPADPGKIHQIPEKILDAFLEAELACVTEGLQDLDLVYTPLNGTGLECVRRALAAAGIRSLYVVPEQERPDGDFPSCPKPNPENPEAMELGLRLCAEKKADLLLATDPDCDRVGVAVPDGEGYSLLSGNEVGILLLNYLCQKRSGQGRMPERPVAVTTIVSTEMADRIAAHWGVELRRTLTGFKYIGEQIGLLEKAGEAERFIFGFEESCGYLSGTHVRDKDGVNACLLICDMAAWYKKRGQSLKNALEALTADYGASAEKLVNCAFPGADGTARMKALMQNLRRQPPKQLNGAAVTAVKDYLDGEKTGLPPADVLAFYLEDGRKVLIRPSGTEPKMKAYIFAHSDTKKAAELAAGGLAETVRSLLTEDRA